jgi:D-alanyl-D-alanine carboxypeptidase/D-alanyl-D-alanine-endopeptidase (penicillin-binding protein 4)
VKALAEAGHTQEWSYGYDVLAAEHGLVDGKEVQILKALHVHSRTEAVAALARRGITVQGGVGENAAAPEGSVEVVAHESAPLSEVAVPLLQQSINLYAEQAWRAAAFYGAPDWAKKRTFADCERHALTTLASMGVPTDGMALADGSGLSRRNLVQPKQLAALLAHAHGAPQLAALRAGLPVAGESGTLRSRFLRGAAKGHVRAKTGFVSYVVGLSGYVDKKDGAAPLLAALSPSDLFS